MKLRCFPVEDKQEIQAINYVDHKTKYWPVGRDVRADHISLVMDTH